MRDSYPIEPGGPHRIFVSHPSMDETHIMFDRETVLRFRGKQELRAGAICMLPDGTSLDVRLVGRQLEVRRAGQLLSGESRSPEGLARRAAFAMILVGMFGIGSIKSGLRHGIDSEAGWTALGLDSLVSIPLLFLGGLILRGFRPALLGGVALMALKLSVLGWTVFAHSDVLAATMLGVNSIFAWLIWTGWAKFRESGAIQ